MTTLELYTKVRFKASFFVFKSVVPGANLVQILTNFCELTFLLTFRGQECGFRTVKWYGLAEN